MQITILGAGEIGQAIKSSLLDGVSSVLWDKQPGKVPEQKSLAEIIPASQLVFLCIPSSAVRGALGEIKPLLAESTVVISLTKGIEAQTGKFIYEVFDEFLLPEQYALLSGPMLAEELATGKGAAGVVATKNPHLPEILSTLFKPRHLRLEFSAHVRSVALAGVLKNIYAVVLGLADGLGYGNNMKGLLVSQILPETQLISEQLSIHQGIMAGTAGLADFVATAFSPYSLNREAGMKIAQGQEAPKSEGIIALPLLLPHLTNIQVLPVLMALREILIDHGQPQAIMAKLLYGA